MLASHSRELKTEALVLKACDWKETDRLLWVLLPSEGLSKVIVKRARKHGASMAGAAQAMAWHTLHLKRMGSQTLSNPLRSGSGTQPYSQITGTLGSEPSWWVLAQYVPQQMFPKLKAHMPNHTLAMLACEMTLGVLEAGGGVLETTSQETSQPYQALWTHVLALLNVLETSPTEVTHTQEVTPWHYVVLLRWLRKLLHLEGWLAEESLCLRCGITLIDYPHAIYWDAEALGGVCHDCATTHTASQTDTSRYSQSSMLTLLGTEEAQAWCHQFAPFWHMPAEVRLQYGALLQQWQNRLLDAWERQYGRKLHTRCLL
jgi:recombinational DNA repair protein (RecF pathway)